MTRQIRFQLKLNGQALKIQSVDRAKGLLFTMDGSDLFPRRCEFTYTPATDFSIGTIDNAQHRGAVFDISESPATQCGRKQVRKSG